MPLTDIQIRNAKSDTRPQKLADGGGLYLLVQPSGSRLWRLKYRFGGKEKTLSIGPYPAVGLKAARVARDEAKAVLAAGGDPMAEKKQRRAEAAVEEANTFRAIASEYRAKLVAEGKASATLAKFDWFMSLADGDIGAMPMRSIKASDVLRVLRRLEAKQNYETASRLRSAVSRVFRYAAASERVDNDPTYALRGAIARPKSNPMAALTDWDGVRRLVLAIDAFEGRAITKAALWLSLLCAQRPGELRQARWDEFDLEERTWTIPASRMKMRRPHRVPLSDQATKVLSDLRQLSAYSNHAFPSVRSPWRCMSENTVNVALRSLGFEKHEATAHGFRATFVTLANESGLWSPDAIERSVAHVDANSVRRVYARSEHWDERVRLFQWWSDRAFSHLEY